MNKEKVQIIASEIRRFHKLIQKANAERKDILISQMNDLIERREELEREIEAIDNSNPVEDTIQVIEDIKGAKDSKD